MGNAEGKSGDPLELAAGSSRGGAQVATFVVIILVAVFLRFYKLGAWSFWADEIFTLYGAMDLSGVRGYPVGYFLIGLVVRLAGLPISEFLARLLPALAGVASVPVLYVIGRGFCSRRTGLIAAGLLAISCYHIYYSQYARYYTLLMLFSMLAMCFAFLGIERNSRVWIAAATAGLILAFLTHWTAGLLVPALALTFLWAARGRGERPPGVNRFNAALLFAPFIVGGLQLAPVFVRFLRGWAGGESFSLIRAALLVLKVADRIEPVVIICAIVGAVVLRLERDYRLKWLAPYAALPPAMVAIFVAFSKGGSRFAIVCLPAWLLLAAYGMDRLIAIGRKKHPVMACALVACVAVSLLIKDARYFTAEMGQRPRWREAVAYVNRHAHVASVVIASTPDLYRWYSEHGPPAEDRPLFDYSPDELQAYFESASGEGFTPVMLVVEHTANVAPTPEQWRVIREHCDVVESYPLRVRFLDYSMSIYLQKKEKAPDG